MSTNTRPKGGLIDKRNAILTAALAVFAREGFSRAGLDAISAEEKVSTRTIYNHFEDKAELFRASIHESAARVADVQVELIDRHLGGLASGADVEAVFVAFATEWSATVTRFQDHFALVLQMPAESKHLPRATVDAWLRTGPMRVRRELAHYFQRLNDKGLLQIDDSDTAAQHFSLLTSAAIPPFYCGSVHEEGETAAAVAAAVRTFLHGCGAR